MSHSLDRRAFLQAFAAAGALPLSRLLPTSGTSVAQPSDRGSGRRIVVLGAGLAGLGAAYNLRRHGYDVTVLEAQDRPGGRVHTVRDGFRGGGHAEMGAVRIFENHEYTLRYVDEFGLELTPYESGTRAIHMDGKRFLPPRAGQPWPLAGLDEDEQPDPGALPAVPRVGLREARRRSRLPSETTRHPRLTPGARTDVADAALAPCQLSASRVTAAVATARPPIWCSERRSCRIARASTSVAAG